MTPALAKKPQHDQMPGMDDSKPEPKPEQAHQEALKELPPEVGGQKGPEPTRYGDWEKNGRCTDF